MENSLFKNFIENLTLKLSLIFKRDRSPNVKGGVNNQESIIGQQSITHIDNQQTFGVSVEDVEHITNKIVDQQLAIYHQSAKQEFISRNDSLSKLIVSEIQKLTPEERVKIAEPDTQLAIGEGLKINGTLQNQEKRDILSDLLIKRIKSDKDTAEELKDIVYSEAIQTIKKLTMNQIKIITLSFISTRTVFDGVLNLQQLDQFLNSFFAPFLNFKESSTDFEHIESVGCGVVQITEHDVIDLISNNYARVFIRNYDKQDIQNMNIPDNYIGHLFEIVPNENKYKFKFQHLDKLNEYLRESELPEPLSEDIRRSYKTGILGSGEIAKILEKDTTIGKTLISKWRSSRIKNLRLNSTGIVIAISNFEKTIGLKLDDNEWIK
jgi:hypothetical protein